MLNILSMQDLKSTSLAKLKLLFKHEPEIIIQERGKDACVLVDLEHYAYLRQCELEIELIRARNEIAAGKYTTGSEAHLSKLEQILNEPGGGNV